MLGTVRSIKERWSFTAEQREVSGQSISFIFPIFYLFWFNHQ